jgi:two-component system, response regulator PdtaR
MPLPDSLCAGSILVVEDEVILRMDLADHLRSSGFIVLEALNGDHALTVLSTEESVRLVITDMRMPGQVDGGALLTWLRQEKPHIKVIVVSGNLAVDALPANADARFSKPLNMDTLLRQVRHLLNEPRP